MARGALGGRGRGLGGPRLAERAQRHDHGGGEDAGADQVREVEAAVERRGVGVARAVSSPVRSVASVASTARPIAPPTCTVVLTRPEARPASSASRPTSRASSAPGSRGRRRGRSGSSRAGRRRRSCRRPACGRTAAGRRRSTAEARRAPCGACRSACQRAGEAQRHRRPSRSSTGRNARPTSSGVVAEDPLQVERAEEEHAEHADDEQRHARGSRRRRCASGTGAAASAGSSMRAWRTTKAASSGDGDRAEAERAARAPAVLARRRGSCRRRASGRRSAAPRRGCRRRAREAERLGRARPAAARSTPVAMPIGRLTKKIQCQLMGSVSTPPASRPIEPPAEATKP